jgi:hypothetical protein
VAALDGEIRGVLRPGGVFANTDHMPDEALGGLTKRLITRAVPRREARYATVLWRGGADEAVAGVR